MPCHKLCYIIKFQVQIYVCIKYNSHLYDLFTFVILFCLIWCIIGTKLCFTNGIQSNKYKHLFFLNTCSLESNKLNVFYREVSRNNRHGKCDINMIS